MEAKDMGATKRRERENSVGKGTRGKLKRPSESLWVTYHAIRSGVTVSTVCSLVCRVFHKDRMPVEREARKGGFQG